MAYEKINPAEQLAATGTPSSTTALYGNNSWSVPPGPGTPGFTTTATAAGTTTLVYSSTPVQEFTGTTTQTVSLPTTSVTQGMQWLIINKSTGAVTVNASGGATVVILAGGTSAMVTANIATPALATDWDAQYGADVVASGKILNVSNSLTLAGVDGKTLTVNNSLGLTGTDSTTMTFPSANATIARTDAAQTFTGVQTMTSPNFTTPVLGTPTSGTLTNCTGYPSSALSGSVAAASQLSGQVPIANGGTNATTAATGLANLAAAGVPNTLLPNGINNANYAAQSQLTVAGTKYYITNSALKLPATPLAGMVAASSALVTGTTFRWRVGMTKTAAGTGTFLIYIFRGTNGTTADTADVSQSIGTQTAQIDSMVFDVQVVVTTTGATGAYYWSIVPVNSTATYTTTAGTIVAAGFGVSTTAAAFFNGTVSSVAMNTASLIFGLGFSSTTGTPTIAIPMVQANCFNMA